MRYSKYFMLTGVLPVLLSFLIGLYIQPVSGDLTRLGNLSERDFGWNAMQQQLTINESPQTQHPKVVVLGDSFSVGNIWQSIASEDSPFTFMTFDWRVISQNLNCLEKWLLDLKDTYPSCDFIIISTIERDFLGRFDPMKKTCPIENKKPLKVKQGHTESIRNFDPRNAMPDPIYAVKSIVNSLHEFKKIEKRKDVFVAPLKRTDLFSNRRSNLILYYENDTWKKNWKKEEVREAVNKAGHIQRLAAEKGITLIFAVVPDKSTAYARYFTYPLFPAPPPDIWAELGEQGVNQVDLKQVLLQAVDSKNQDIYLPNDTHLGSTGYLLMGKAISDKLKEFDPQLNN